MKKKLLWLIPAALLVALLVTAGVLYPRLAGKLTPGHTVPAGTTAGETDVTTEGSGTVIEESGTVPEESGTIAETAGTTAVTPTEGAITTTAKVVPPAETTTQTTSAKVVDYAPDFIVQDANGDSDALSMHRGKPVVVNFWATWCYYCCEELPHFNEAAKKYGDKVDFMMVDLVDGYQETAEDAKAFVEKYGYTFPVYYDTRQLAADAYGVPPIPLTLFINADGSVYDTYLGMMSAEILQNYLDALIAA